MVEEVANLFGRGGHDFLAVRFSGGFTNAATFCCATPQPYRHDRGRGGVQEKVPRVRCLSWWTCPPFDGLAYRSAVSARN